MTFSPVVLIRFAEPVAFDVVFAQWVEPLRRIVSLSTGRKESITYLALRLATSDCEALEFQVYGTALHQSPYASLGNNVMKLERAFFLSPDDMSLLDMLHRWQHLAEEHHPILETYASLMYAPDQHPRSRFLLLIQAIEGLYGYETRGGFDDRVDRHGARRTDALAEASASLGEETLQFLRKYLMKRPPSSLDEAISKTLSTVPVDVSPALAQSALIVGIMADELKSKTMPESLRQIRNDLAHGTRGYDPQELYDVVVLLDSVVRAHMLRILGCSEDAQRRSQERRR